MDYDSEQILQTLRDRGEPVGTGALQEETTQNQNKPVLDRLEKLQEAGLVDLSHTEEVPGAVPDRQMWEISDSGRSFVDEHREAFSSTTAELLGDTLSETQQRVDLLDKQLDDIVRRLDTWQDTRNRRASRLHQLSERVERAEETAETANELLIASAEQSEVDELRAEIDRLAREQQDIREEIESLRNEGRRRRDKFNEWAEHWARDVNQNAEAIEDLKEALEEVRELAESGLL